MKGEEDMSKLRVGHCDTSLSIMDRMTRQKDQPGYETLKTL